MIIELLKKAQTGEHLTADEAFAAFREIMNGEVTNPVHIAAILTAMQMNGPTATEVTGAARAMRGAGIKVKAPANAVDIVGTGGDGFYHSLADCTSAEALYDQFLATPQDKTIPDQWESQILARLLKSRTIIAVSRPELEQTFRDMKMKYAKTLEEALAMAEEIVGKDYSLTLIPNGISVIVE